MPYYAGGFYPGPYDYTGGYAIPPEPPIPPSPPVPPPPPSPSVIVNPDYKPEKTNPTLHVYTYVPDDQKTQSTPQVYFLIAMKDHTIYPAIAYWVENSTLEYIDRDGALHKAALDSVDRDFSIQLNKERNVDFGLPQESAH